MTIYPQSATVYGQLQSAGAVVTALAKAAKAAAL